MHCRISGMLARRWAAASGSTRYAVNLEALAALALEAAASSLATPLRWARLADRWVCIGEADSRT